MSGWDKRVWYSKGQFLPSHVKCDSTNRPFCAKPALES